MNIEDIRLAIEIKPPTHNFPYWIVTYPEITLATQGATRQDAMNNAKEALRLWLSDLIYDGILKSVLQKCFPDSERALAVEEDVQAFFSRE